AALPSISTQKMVEGNLNIFHGGSGRPQGNSSPIRFPACASGPSGPSLAVSAVTAHPPCGIIVVEPTQLDGNSVCREQAPTLGVPARASAATINVLAITTIAAVSAHGGV